MIHLIGLVDSRERALAIQVSLSIFGWVLCALSVFLIIANIGATVHNYRGGKYVSMVPLFGGLSGMVGLLLLPSPNLKGYAWIPLLLDLGCLPSIIAYFVYVGGQRFSGRDRKADDPAQSYGEDRHNK